MSATLKDVANLAQVSVCAVSYVINRTGLHKVGKDTQRHILEAAAKLKYQPSMAGRALKKGKTFLVGAILPTITSSFVPEMLEGLEDCLNQADYSLILCTHKNIDEFKHKCDILRRKQVDGTVILPEMGDAFLRICDQLATQMPVAFVAQQSTNPAIISVCTDGEEVGYLGVKYLLERGHRQICVPAGNNWRIQGYIRAFKEFGLMFDERMLFPRSNPDQGRKMLQWALKQKIVPTAFYPYSDMFAMELIDEAAELGFKLPEKFSVIGTDGLSICEVTRPRLTTVAQPRYEQGFKVGELLLARISNQDVQNLMLHPYIQERQSVKRLMT